MCACPHLRVRGNRYRNPHPRAPVESRQNTRKAEFQNFAAMILWGRGGKALLPLPRTNQWIYYLVRAARCLVWGAKP